MEASTDIEAGHEVLTSYSTRWWLGRVRKVLLERASDQVQDHWNHDILEKVDCRRQT